MVCYAKWHTFTSEVTHSSAGLCPRGLLPDNTWYVLHVSSGKCLDSLILISTDTSSLSEHLLQVWVWGGLLLGHFRGAGLAGSPALGRRPGLLRGEHACLGGLHWRGATCWSDLLWRSRRPLLLRGSGLGTLGLLSLRREPLLWGCICSWRLRSLWLPWPTWKGHVDINVRKCTCWATRTGFANRRDSSELFHGEEYFKSSLLGLKLLSCPPL